MKIKIKEEQECCMHVAVRQWKDVIFPYKINPEKVE